MLSQAAIARRTVSNSHIGTRDPSLPISRQSAHSVNHRERGDPRDRVPRSRRQHRRITGYHNAFDESCPPDYFRIESPSPAHNSTALPAYDCTIHAADILEIMWEKTNPFQPAQTTAWQSVHVELRGTLLQISNAKIHGLLTPAWKRGKATGEAGRRIRSYTLQHGEVGLASDHKKIEMVPKSPIAQLLPESALRQLQESDPSQFEIVYNYIARVRLESDQILLRFQNSEQRTNWVDNICAAIDIAPPLEARSEPRNHTLPRRRRHHDAQRFAIGSSHGQSVAPANVIAEQEQILREHYPHFSHRIGAEQERRYEEPPGPHSEPSHGEETTEAQELEQAVEPDVEPDPDYQDLDITFMRDLMPDIDTEDNERHLSGVPNVPAPPGSRQMTDQQSSPSRLCLGIQGVTALHTSSHNPSNTAPPSLNNSSLRAAPQSSQLDRYVHDENRKYRTRHPRPDPSRDARYRRRCMPILVHNSRYATNIIMHKGKRKVIDWQNKKLVSWPAAPPTYHDFLYGYLPEHTTDPRDQRESYTENILPGTGNAISWLREVLRQRVSFEELDHSLRPSTDSNPKTPRRPQQSPSGLFRGFRSGNRTVYDSSPDLTIIRSCPHSKPAAPRPSFQHSQTCHTPTKSTHAVTSHTEYPSSGDVQSFQSSALSYTDPTVKSGTSDNSAFGAKLRQHLGRKNTGQIDDTARMRVRDEQREEDGVRIKAHSRLARIRTASSLDVIRGRF